MTVSPDPLRVGLVGYGFAGRRFHAPLIAATPGLVLAAVASSQAEVVAADFPGATVMPDAGALIAVEDIDLIVLATPNVTHKPLARAALEAGKAVVVDKPFTPTLADARDLVALADERSALLSVFHNRRWDTDFLGVRAVIREGLLGRITQFESHMDRFRPDVRERWRERPGPGAGLWFDLGPHLVDQALQLFGLPNRIFADLAKQRTGAQVDDWAHVVLDYDPLRVILHCSSLVSGGVNRFTVHGTSGSAIKRGPDPQDGQIQAGMIPGAPGWGVDPDPITLWTGDGVTRDRAAPCGDRRAFYIGVRDAMRGTGSNPVPPSQAVAVMAVLEDAVRSASVGGFVPLSLTETERLDFSASFGDARPRS